MSRSLRRHPPRRERVDRR